jgi:hypothetical protein
VVDSTVHWWSLMDQKRWKRDRTRLSRMHITSCEHTSCKKTIPKLCHSCTISAKIFVTVKGHSGGALWWGTLVGHSCKTPSGKKLVWHFRETLLWDTSARHSCETLLEDFIVKRLLWEALVRHSLKTFF